MRPACTVLLRVHSPLGGLCVLPGWVLNRHYTEARLIAWAVCNIPRGEGSVETTPAVQP